MTQDSPPVAPTPEGHRADSKPISKAALMAGKWWADRLHEQHAGKRQAFAAAVASRVQRELDGDSYWKWGDSSPQPGDGKTRNLVRTQCDYDPCSLLLDAVRETVDPKCRGFCYSAEGLLPMKHSLDVRPDKLCPKEGYGNWTADIQVIPNFELAI